MAELEEAVYSLAMDDSGIAGVLGQRFYPSVAEQGCARPYAIYHLISQVRFETMGSDAGVRERRIQIDVLDTTKAGCIAAMAAISAACSRASGTYAGIVIQQIFEQTMQDWPFDEETRLYRRSADYLIYYEA